MENCPVCWYLVSERRPKRVVSPPPKRKPKPPPPPPPKLHETEVKIKQTFQPAVHMVGTIHIVGTTRCLLLFPLNSCAVIA